MFAVIIEAVLFVDLLLCRSNDQIGFLDNLFFPVNTGRHFIMAVNPLFAQIISQQLGLLVTPHGMPGKYQRRVKGGCQLHGDIACISVVAVKDIRGLYPAT
jgi:hypothetical protein